jgi:hypothetical protein
LLAAVALGLAATSCSGNVTYEVSDATTASSSSSSDAATKDSDATTTLPDYGTTMSQSSYASTSYWSSSIALAYMPAPVDTGVANSDAASDASDSAEVCPPCGCGNTCIVPVYGAAVRAPDH